MRLQELVARSCTDIVGSQHEQMNMEQNFEAEQDFIVQE